MPLSFADLAALHDAYNAALALQAEDIRWHSAATTHARHSYRAVHHGLDPVPYHAHLIGLWHDRLAFIAEQLPHVAPTSGSADSAGQLAAPAPADAVAAAVNAASGDANVVGTSVVPARVVSPHLSRTLALQALDSRWHSAVSSDNNVVGTSESAVGATAAPADAVAAGVVVAGDVVADIVPAPSVTAPLTLAPPPLLQPVLVLKLLPWLLTLLLRQLCRLQSTVDTAAVGSAVPTVPPAISINTMHHRQFSLAASTRPWFDETSASKAAQQAPRGSGCSRTLSGAAA